jgi:hypothetical protein
MICKQKKTILRLHGGLGNQLFSYAAARRFSIVNKTKLVIDNETAFKKDLTYNRFYELDGFSLKTDLATYKEKLKPLPTLRHKVKRNINIKFPVEERSYVSQFHKIDDFSLLKLKQKSSVLYIEGYWQSELFFQDCSDIIKQDLTINTELDELSQQFENLIKTSNSVAVHIRFYDDKNDENKILNKRWMLDYYSAALQKMEESIHKPVYFIFTNRPDIVDGICLFPNERCHIIQHNLKPENSFKDFWLMTCCKNFIIANSTFSWWGAWLSTCPYKKIIAPEPHNALGTGWQSKSIIPKSWDTL